MSASARTGCAAHRRQAAARLESPAHRRSPRVGCRRAAITWGMWPHRPGDRSSSHVTSRTPCDWFSICQCPRTRSRTRAGVARGAVRRVTPSTVSARTAPVCGLITDRGSANTGASPGHAPYSARAWLVVKRRGSRRPCPQSRGSAVAWRSPTGGSATISSRAERRWGWLAWTLMTSSPPASTRVCTTAVWVSSAAIVTTRPAAPAGPAPSRLP